MCLLSNFNTLCQQFGEILNGKAEMKEGACSVEMKRHIPVTIQGRPVHSEIHTDITFESLDVQGNALNLGETVILEEEIPLFVHALVKSGIIISAIHNHWLYTHPKILYIHFQSVEPPLTFAYKMAEALKTLKQFR